MSCRDLLSHVGYILGEKCKIWNVSYMLITDSVLSPFILVLTGCS